MLAHRNNSASFLVRILWFRFMSSTSSDFYFVSFLEFCLITFFFCLGILSENDDKEIERYSDRKRKTQSKREALASYLKLIPANFPAELLHGSLEVHTIFVFCYVVAAQ